MPGCFTWMIRVSGGTGADAISASRVVEEMARIDGSACWCLMIAAQCAAFSAWLPEQEVRHIYGNGGIVAGTARPIGRAAATITPEQGFNVSGKWPIASGSSHATWFAAECIVYDGDEKCLDANGHDVTRMCFVPAAEVTVIPTGRLACAAPPATTSASRPPSSPTRAPSRSWLAQRCTTGRRSRPTASSS